MVAEAKTSGWLKDMVRQSEEDETPCVAPSSDAMAAPLPDTPPLSRRTRSRSNSRKDQRKDTAPSPPRLTRRKLLPERRGGDNDQRIATLEDQREEDQFYFKQVQDFVNAMSYKTEANERLAASHEKRLKWLNDDFISNFRKEFEKKHENITKELMGLFGRFDVVLETNVKEKMDKESHELLRNILMRLLKLLPEVGNEVVVQPLEPLFMRSG